MESFLQLAIYWFETSVHPWDVSNTHLPTVPSPQPYTNKKEQFTKQNNRFFTYRKPLYSASYLKLVLHKTLLLTERESSKGFTELFWLAIWGAWSRFYIPFQKKKKKKRTFGALRFSTLNTASTSFPRRGEAQTKTRQRQSQMARPNYFWLHSCQLTWPPPR